MRIALALLVPVFAEAAPTSTADVIGLAAGARSTCAVHADGAVSCWGSNHSGQLGDGTTTSRSTPVRMVGIADAVEVAADHDRTCVRRRGGTLACFGAVSPTQPKATSPVAIPATDVEQVAGSCWRSADGTASCLSRQGQVVRVGTLDDVVDIAASGDAGCAARKSGKVACWFAPNDVKPIAGVANIVDVAYATGFVCGRTKAGATTCWNWAMQRPKPTMRPTAPQPPKQLPVVPLRVGVTAKSLVGGWGRVCAATARDTRCWDSGRRVTKLAGFGATSVIAVSLHTCALRGGRDVACWGPGTDGQLGFGWAEGRATPTPLGATDAVEVSASFSPGTREGSTCVRRRTNAVACWGNVSPHNSSGGSVKPREVFKRASRFVRASIPSVIDDQHRWRNAIGWTGRLPPVIAADGDCAITKDSRVLCTSEHRPNNDHDPNHPDGEGVAISGLGDATKLAIGGNHACALRRTGQIACFRERGKLEVDAKVTDAIDLAAGLFALCVVHRAKTVSCKGQRGSWLLYGNPLKRTGDADWTAIAITDVVELSAGADHACVRKANGTVECWGDNNRGQLGDGTLTPRTAPAPVPGLTDVIQISAGAHHTCALQKAGTVMCWGDAISGQIGSYVMDNVVEPTSVTW